MIIERLLALEKKARLVRRVTRFDRNSSRELIPTLFPQAGDASAVGKVAVAIARACWATRDLAQLNANILVVVKRRAQLKQAIAELVQEAMTYIDQIPSRDDRLQLVSTLRTVTDGKVRLGILGLKQPLLSAASIPL